MFEMSNAALKHVEGVNDSLGVGGEGFDEIADGEFGAVSGDGWWDENWEIGRVGVGSWRWAWVVGGHFDDSHSR